MPSTYMNDVLAREVLKSPRPIFNFHEWLVRLDAADTLNAVESLLHCGFTVPLERMTRDEPEYDRADRYTVYLALADGWDDIDSLRFASDANERYSVYDQSGKSIEKWPCGLRQQRARKAFDMLAANLFKTELMVEGKFHWIWQREIASAKLLPVIQNFFRPERRACRDDSAIRNFSSDRRERWSHSEEQAAVFVENLAEFIWGWKEPDIRYWPSKEEGERGKKLISAMRARINAAKPWTIEVLSWLGRLRILQGRMLEFDGPCLAKLRDLAMGNRLRSGRDPVMKDRRVATLDEACYSGSESAWFLRWRELKLRESKRLNGILKAEWEKIEASRKIELLTSVNKG